VRRMAVDVVTMDKIVSLARRRGFVFPSSEIYGGLGSTYDYGHYGVLLKNNIRSRWFEAMVQDRDDIVAIDTAVILHPPVWEASGTYLRPETAPGIFINFKNVLQIARRRPPFGIAQVGKSFRNEITPGNFLFRVREFEQMEMEYFVPPDEAEQWYRYWIDERLNWYLRYGLRRSRLRVREHGPEE